MVGEGNEEILAVKHKRARDQSKTPEIASLSAYVPKKQYCLHPLSQLGNSTPRSPDNS